MANFFLITLLLIYTPFALSAEFIIGINEREVFRYKDENGRWVGKDIELINAVFRRTPHSYKLVAMPWARVLKSLELGQIDMTVAAAALPERKQYAWFSTEPFRYSYYTLFIRKDREEVFKHVQSLADIKNSPALIGALRSAVYTDSYYTLLQDQGFAKHLVFIDDDQSLPALTMKGRVDGYIESETEGMHYLHANPEYRDKIEPLLRVTNEAESSSFMMFSKQSFPTAELATFSAALKAVHDSGEYQHIAERYQPLNN